MSKYWIVGEMCVLVGADRQSFCCSLSQLSRVPDFWQAGSFALHHIVKPDSACQSSAAIRLQPSQRRHVSDFLTSRASPLLVSFPSSSSWWLSGSEQVQPSWFLVLIRLPAVFPFSGCLPLHVRTFLQETLFLNLASLSLGGCWTTGSHDNSGKK